MWSKPPPTVSVAEVKIHAARLRSRCSRSGPDTSIGVRWQRNPRGVSSYQSTSAALAASAGSVSKSRVGSSSPSQRDNRETASRARAWQASRPVAASRSGCSACSSATRQLIAVSKPSRTCGIANARHWVPRDGSPSMARRSASSACCSWSTGSCSADCAPPTPRASARQSRASSCHGRMPKPSPKNCAASSGNWCASSMTKACAPGSSSPKPSCFSARSASSRWWLTTTTSAACARCRACTTKQSSQNGQSVPRQLSTVEVTIGSSGESSARPSSSAISPNCERPDQARMRWNCAACSGLEKRGSPRACCRR